MCYGLFICIYSFQGQKWEEIKSLSQIISTFVQSQIPNLKHFNSFAIFLH